MLPLGFTELEYIESTRTQWIDTGVIPATFDYTITYEGAIKTLSDGPNVAWGFMGDAGGGNLPRWLCATWNGNWLLNANQTESISGADTNNHTFAAKVYDNNGTPYWSSEIDGVTKDNQSLGSTNTWQANTLSIYLFARHNSDGAGNFVSCTMKRWICAKNGVLVRSFIPALRNSDGELGMYDEVTGTFFTNQGTGKFIAGPKVLISSGKEITGYYPTKDIEGETTIIGTPSPVSPAIIKSKEPYSLNKVGTYADEYLLNGGTVDSIVVPPKGILRRVGVKVLDGTESWSEYILEGHSSFYIFLSDMIKTSSSTPSSNFMNTHIPYVATMWVKDDIGYAVSTQKRMFFRRQLGDTLAEFKSWLASEYAKGTPVTVYYPLATPIVEQPHLAIVPSFKSVVMKKSRNLFDISMYNQTDKWIGTNYRYIKMPLPNGTYTMRWDKSTMTAGNNIYWLLQVDEPNKGTSSPGTGGSWVWHADIAGLQYGVVTFTVTQGAVWLTCSFSAYFNRFVSALSTVQIEEGSVATPYEPYGLIPVPSYKQIIKL